MQENLSRRHILKFITGTEATGVLAAELGSNLLSPRFYV